MNPLSQNLNYNYLESQILPDVSKGHLTDAMCKSPDLKRKLYDEMSMEELEALHKEAQCHKNIGTAADSITGNLINIMVELVIHDKKTNDRESLKYTGLESILLGNYQGFYPGYPEDLVTLSLDEVRQKIKKHSTDS